MDLMTLAAKLTLDDSGFRSGISNAESAGQNLAGKLSSMTVAVGNIMADVIKKGFNTVKDLVGGAVNAYADYQQMIGGVETLFGQSADKVAAYAKEAYRTAGVSANNYMETVTSFSASLLQGLKGDTEQAAELANMAITDMADNANKMGTDMSSIQTAYQGFAKQNYTMLDNLKLGYGGTKEEMLRLVNDSGVLKQKVESLDDVSFDQMIEAIHKIQQEMGITGTTAEEADQTISGSAASMKAAWQDLLSAIGGEGGQANLNAAMEKFKSSFGTYMENFIPTLTTTIANSGSLVEAVAGAVANLPTDLLANLGSAALEGGTGMIQGAGKIVHWLIESIANVFKTASVDTTDIAAFGEALGNFLGSTISDLVTNAPAIIEGVFAAGVSLAGSFIQGLFGGIFGGPEVEEIQKKLGKELFTIDKQTTEANAILNYMQQLVEKYGNAATKTIEWKNAEKELETILGGAGQVFEDYGGDIDGAIQKLKEMNNELRRTAIMNALSSANAEALKMYAQQELEYQQQKYRKESGESKIQSYEERAREGIVEAAGKQAAEYWNRTHDEAGNEIDFFDETQYNDLLLLANGMNRVGDEIVKLKDVDFEGLSSIISSLMDEDLSKKYEADEQLYAEAKTQIDDAKTKMADAQKEMEATKKTIDELEAATAKAAEELFKEFGLAGTNIENGGTIAEAAFKSFAARVNSIRIKSAIGEENWSKNRYPTPNFGPSIYPGMPIPEAGHATGMDYVPYDGYRAVLHKGEAIITREENEARRGGVSYEDIEQALADAIERGMEHLYINMSGEKVADITTRRTASNISTNEHARTRAMGG